MLSVAGRRAILGGGGGAESPRLGGPSDLADDPSTCIIATCMPSQRLSEATDAMEGS